MKPRRIAVEVSSTVRRPSISIARARELVERTMHAEKIRGALVSIAFVGERAIARLNQTYLDHAGPTDVVSFGMGRDHRGAPVIGDIYICPEVARKNAKRLGVPVRNEIERLVVHGALHVIGYDHPADEGRMSSPMWRKQERILERDD